ncbi:hypothetical protein DID88_003602 [Monilinia fructigena]|uniref:Uncharacterized protein n=1 Tax=Monilinia fructigena TaxID=38457 RepID=A0A395IV64_9HELO|nr:hypothetical protein DID88_003602 [Monilinia fructigena]
MPPKNPGGRPKKYATKAEAKAAGLEKRQYRRQQARLLAGPAVLSLRALLRTPISPSGSRQFPGYSNLMGFQKQLILV